jgi:hypothetical protein
MTLTALYRTDIQSAVRMFRPVLKALTIRDFQKHRPVYFSDFAHLDFLDLDKCSVQILTADLGDCTGMFIGAHTEKDLLRNYIVLNSALFSDKSPEIQEKLKITAVHEFCHFLAIVYALTTISIVDLKEKLTERLKTKIDRLSNEAITELYTLLSSIEPDTASDLDEATDHHFRLDCEDFKGDYYILFCYLLFSRELFETVFDEDKQKKFRTLFRRKVKQNDAVMLMLNSLRTVTEQKWIPYDFAYKQLKKWAYKYTS